MFHLAATLRTPQRDPLSFCLTLLILLHPWLFPHQMGKGRARGDLSVSPDLLVLARDIFILCILSSLSCLWLPP